MISRRNILLFTFTSSFSGETSKRLVTPTKLTFISNFQNKRNSARQLKIGAYASTVSKDGFHSILTCPPSLPPREKKAVFDSNATFFSKHRSFSLNFGSNAEEALIWAKSGVISQNPTSFSKFYSKQTVNLTCEISIYFMNFGQILVLGPRSEID